MESYVKKQLSKDKIKKLEDFFTEYDFMSSHITRKKELKWNYIPKESYPDGGGRSYGTFRPNYTKQNYNDIIVNSKGGILTPKEQCYIPYEGLAPLAKILEGK